MRFLLDSLNPRYHASTQALILCAAPERGECVDAWAQTPSDPDADATIRRDYVAVDANDPMVVIGYGAIWPQREGRFRMDLIVAQAWRRHGIGEALLQRLMAALRTQNAMIVQARTRDDRPHSLAFLMRRGFTQTNRMIHLRLSIANASTGALAPLTAGLDAKGITIVTLDREQVQTADCSAKIQQLIRASTPERVSNPYRVGSDTELCSAEDAKRAWESYRSLRPDAFFLAKKGEGYIGLSFLGQEGATGEVVQGDTAVHSDWRRQGIATLLKLHTIVYARQHGYVEITTSTASPGMLALNERLGFRQEWVEERVVKVMKDA